MPAHRVLVVDDDPDILDYFTSFLEDHGCDVRTAVSAANALSALEESRPDVVLIDVMMPGKSGLDLLVKLRRDRRWGDIPLVVVTGNDQILEDDCHSYLGTHQDVRGPDGVLSKPIDRDTLLALLDRLCGRGSG
jgi:CheY-like chemotaxis protein